MKFFDRKNYRYTALFCEENIWWLARSLTSEGFNIDSMQILMFSNSSKSIVMQNQQVAGHAECNLWDYHVVLQLDIDSNSNSMVLDFDTQLPFPVLLDDYMHNSFPVQSMLPIQFQSQVRSIPATDFITHFYSDRSHMNGVISHSKFPEYPVIQPAEGVKKVSLNDYLDFQLSIQGSLVFPV